MTNFLPSKLYAGYKSELRLPINNYDPSTFAVTLTLKGASELTVDAQHDGVQWGLDFTAPTTAGTYAYAIAAHNPSGKYLIATGKVTVQKDPATVDANADLRSHAERTLSAIEAVIENRATKDQQSYSIAGRTLSRTPIADLLLLRTKYRDEVAREQNRRPRNILYRFGSR